MALISQSVKNLKGGISQQPDILRYSDQGAQQINAWSSETEGLQKRPPFVFTKTIGDSAFLGTRPLVHLINRDAFEQYYVVFTGRSIKVFDLKGNEYNVKGNLNYVTVDNPRNDLRMVTVADYTFIVNKNMTVRPDTNIIYNLKEDGDCLINIRGGQYGRTLAFIINGVRVAYKIPIGDKPEHVNETDAQWLVRKLIEIARGNKAFAGWSFWEGSGFIHVVAPEHVHITSITTEDGYGNQLMNAVMHTAQAFNRLPVEAPQGYTVKIVGDTSKTSDQFFVTYDSIRKVWKETVGWGVQRGLDVNSMPHALVRQANGEFELISLPWANRQCGDMDTNPTPSIVDQKINDVFFFRNRLGFLAGENIVMSRTSKYFNLFPASVANLSDDDPIDVAVSHNRISILKYAVPFSEELLLWSDKSQFVLSANGILTNKTVELNPTTEFDVSDDARPFGIGRGVYFISPRASFTSLYRYYAVQDVSHVKSAEDMTAHVPSYLPQGVFSIRGSGTENFVCVLSDRAPNKIFIYKYLYQEEQIVQQSWSHWDFGKGVEILACDCIGSTMYLILQSLSHTWMAKATFTKNTIDYPDEPFRIYADNKMEYIIPFNTYNDDTYTTTIKPTDIYGMKFYYNTFYVVFTDGNTLTFNPPSGGWANGVPVLQLNGNQENQLVYIGVAIDFKYEFSKFLIKKTADDGSTATEDIGRLQLRRAWINYEDSGAFMIKVNNSSSEYSYDMAGARLSSNNLVIGKVNVGTGQFKFPVSGNAMLNTVTVVSSYITPLNIIGCGWEGNYIRRSSGI